MDQAKKLEIAIKYIQRFWRKYRRHCLLQSLLERSRASIKLQAKFRSVRRRSTLLKGDKRKASVLLTINDNIQRRMRQEHAAVIIQRMFRGNFDRQYTALRYVVLTRNALTIQKAWRIYWIHCNIDAWSLHPHPTPLSHHPTFRVRIRIRIRVRVRVRVPPALRAPLLCESIFLFSFFFFVGGNSYVHIFHFPSPLRFDDGPSDVVKHMFSVLFGSYFSRLSRGKMLGGQSIGIHTSNPNMHSGSSSDFDTDDDDDDL
jgi:hypothetical protein